ncbi:MAG: 4-hydroxy-tetrahydrodipicolinate synthase [Sinomicrobium sp.]|nr:4-hydroxy-tetrahydrodipicolinate synthase [Sinomicrobium sp.]
MRSLYGTGVALVTPFKADFSVDAEALSRLVEYVTEGGADYLVALGTTAETATLTAAEKETVKQLIATANNGRLPMVLGVGGNDTAAVVRQLKTTDLSAYEAVLSVSPYYNKPTQEGIYRHFMAVAETSPKPVILYNVPGRTASNMTPQTVFRLAGHTNITGIKEAAGDLVQAMRLLKDKPEDFLVISGDDMLALPIVLAGGAGVISVIAQGFPETFSRMITLGLQGRVREAYALHYQLAESIDLIFEEGNPAGIKAMLEQLGIARDTVRLPLVGASEGLKVGIAAFTEGFTGRDFGSR